MVLQGDLKQFSPILKCSSEPPIKKWSRLVGFLFLGVTINRGGDVLQTRMCYL